MRWILFLMVVMAGFALALDPVTPPATGTAQQQGLFSTFFNLNEWLRRMAADFDRLEAGALWLGLALVLVGFLYGILQGVVSGGLEAIKGTFVRLAVVALLLHLGTLGFIGNTVTGAMDAARTWSTDRAAGALSEAANNLDTLAMRMLPFMGALTAIRGFSAKTADKAIQTSARTANAVNVLGTGASKALSYINWAMLLIIPMLLFFFVILVVASFTIAVGLALYPLIVALLIFPRGAAADWFGKWVAAIVGALLIVILLPLGFSAAVDLGINRPVYTVNDHVDQALDQIRTFQQEHRANIQQMVDNNVICEGAGIGHGLCVNLVAGFHNAKAQLGAVLQQVGLAVQMWLLGIVLMLAGMAAAAYVLFSIERVVMSFVGGFVATGVRNMMGAAGGGRLVPGGQASTVTPATAPPGMPPAGPLATIPSNGPQGGSAQPVYPRPVAYDIQPAYGGRGGDIIEGKYRQISGRELGPGESRGLPPPRSER
jgi:hypothetical protein